METLPDDLKTWIADNLIQGASPLSILQVLANIGISEALAQQEVAQAAAHPYLKAGQHHFLTLRKREALLKTLDHYEQLDPGYLNVTPVPLPPFQAFLREYVAKNRPGLFKGAAEHWPARQWTPRSLVPKVGADTLLEVQRGRESDEKYEINGYTLKSQMAFGEFIDRVENDVTNDIYLTANNLAFSQNAALAPLMQDVGNLGDGYLDRTQSHERMFLWIGPGGTITPLHHDKTHNLFLQIYGKKRFRMIPALQVPYMYNNLGVFSGVDMLKPDLIQHPHFAKVTPVELVVESGDLLYIPIGWWHHVVGESPSISVSFTNIATLNNSFADYPE